MIKIKPISQRDFRWNLRKLGDNSAPKDSTIGMYGCLLADITMLTNYYTGIDWTPLQLNYLINKYNGFNDGNQIIHSTIQYIFSEFRFDRLIRCESQPAPIQLINEQIDKGNPVILKVDFNIKTAPVDGHFVLAIDRDNIGKNYWINDPWLGRGIWLLEQYGKPEWDIARAIFGVIIYEKSLMP